MITRLFGGKKGRYSAMVQQLMLRHIGINKETVQQQNPVWGEWLETEEGLVDLLNASDVNDAFKARAVTIMFVPDIKLCPFKWVEHMGRPDLIDCSKFSPGLLGYTAELAVYNLHSLSDFKLRDVIDVKAAYNNIIVRLLQVLSQDDPLANELFEQYSLIDPRPFYGFDDISGYDPFYQLLSSAVPMKWKNLADSAMREIIAKESTGELKPRTDWEGAFDDYVNRIESCLYRDVFPYDVELLASQLDYILDHRFLGKGLKNSFPLPMKTISLLAGDEYRVLRNRFVREKVLGGVGNFRICNKETLDFATKCLEELGSDEELAPVLQASIEDWNERSEKENQKKEAKRIQAANLRKLMG